MTIPEQILLKFPTSVGLKSYIKYGGFTALKKAIEMKPEEIVFSVKTSNITGRGGAGFPAGLKWEFCSKDPAFPKYIICNADEGEPGTFKDRLILENNPFAVIEGMIISAIALSAKTGYIYLRGEFFRPMNILNSVLKECYDSGYLGKRILSSKIDFDIYVHPGAGAYICGEETALMESLEGKVGQPRSKPPFPVNVGLFGKPTVLNNVETFYNIPYIVNIGGEKYAAIGDSATPGPRIFSLSGSVKRPGCYELNSNNTFRDLIYGCGGGIKNDRNLKCFFPGGSSSPLLIDKHLDVKLENNAVKKSGSMLGSAACIVIDDTICMVETCLNLLQFYQHESCGKCTPCRLGTYWLVELLERIKENDATPMDLENLTRLSIQTSAGCFCPLAVGAVNCIISSMKYFHSDFEDHVYHNKKCGMWK